MVEKYKIEINLKKLYAKPPEVLTWAEPLSKAETRERPNLRSERQERPDFREPKQRNARPREMGKKELTVDAADRCRFTEKYYSKSNVKPEVWFTNF